MSELIPVKTRRKQQPLLDYTKNIILTSRDYIKGLEEFLAKKESTTAAAQKKEGERGKQGATQATARATTKKEARSRSSKSTEKQEREMQQLTKRHRRGTANRDDTITKVSELPNISDTPNAVQQGTNGIFSSQQAIPQH